MKLYMQLIDPEKDTGPAASWVDMNVSESDLELPFDIFAKMFFQPALEQMKRNRAEVKA